MEMRACRVCGIEKPLGEFTPDRRGRSGRSTRCRECNATRGRERWRDDPEYRDRQNAKRQQYYLENRLEAAYGITNSQYEEMLARQGDACALCGSPSHGRHDRWRRWNVDHDHQTGCVRGLLCMSCNLAIAGYEKLKARAGDERLVAYLAGKFAPENGAVAKAAQTGHGFVSRYGNLTDDQVRSILRDPRPNIHIAREYGTSPQYISDIKRRIARRNIEIDDSEIAHHKGAQGEMRSRNLTEADARTIHDSAERTGILAKRHGVSPATICDIRKERSWRHLWSSVRP